jgi:hypothetical protein
MRTLLRNPSRRPAAERAPRLVVGRWAAPLVMVPIIVKEGLRESAASDARMMADTEHMLPRELHGPGQTIAYAGSALVTEFLQCNAERYPHLDRDFIVEICFEFPDRFDDLLPGFDVASHSAVRVVKTASWLIENVRYDRGEPVVFHLPRFRMLMARNDANDEVLGPMIANGTWHFPPVIIESDLAVSLGAPHDIGRPYYLIEGTHRLSYLHGLVDRDMISKARELEVIQIQQTQGYAT